MAERATDHSLGLSVGEHPGDYIIWRRLKKSVGLLVRGKERFNFAAQFVIAGAGLGKKGGALLR
jgi:hypothetical protein